MATACGIGGGVIYSSFLLFVENFKPSVAFPISNFLILVSAVTTFYTTSKDKKEHPKSSFVDYDLAMIFSPAMLLGTKFGTILNKTCSNMILTICLIIMLSISLKSTYKNKVKAENKEKEKEENMKLLLKNNNEENNNEDINMNLKLENCNFYIKNENVDQKLIKEIEDEDNNPYPIKRIKFFIKKEIFVILDQIIEGNAKVSSLLGITKCSFIYWFVFILYFILSMYFIKEAVNIINDWYDYKINIIPNIKKDKISYVQNNLIKIIIFTILAGVISSMIGVGGGMVTNPLLLSMGIDPKATSSTSNFLIMTTAIASTFIFTLSGQFQISYAIYLGIPCSISAFYGSKAILSYINTTGKTSILLKIMVYFLVACGIIIVFKTIFQFNDIIKDGIFKMNSYC